jgi:hypothetical protein
MQAIRGRIKATVNRSKTPIQPAGKVILPRDLKDQPAVTEIIE